MSFEELTLRDLLASPYAQGCALAIIGSVEGGNPLIITMRDGWVIILEKGAEVRVVFRELFECKRV